MMTVGTDVSVKSHNPILPARHWTVYVKPSIYPVNLITMTYLLISEL